MKKKENSFKVDCIVPYFDDMTYIVETIESLLNQNPKLLGQIIIVDDGSQESAKSILERALVHDSRIKFLTLESNKGESSAVNSGWRQSNSDWVSIISSDDPQQPDWLDSMAFFIFNNVEPLFYYPNRIVIDEKSMVVRIEILRKFKKRDLLKSLICVPSAGTIIHKAKLPSNFLPRDEGVRFPSDLIQFLKLIRFGEGAKVDSAWGTWREHSHSQSSKIDVEKKFEFMSQALTAWASKNPDLLSISQVRIACLLQTIRSLKSTSLGYKWKFVSEANLLNGLQTNEALKSIFFNLETFLRGKYYKTISRFFDLSRSRL